MSVIQRFGMDMVIIGIFGAAIYAFLIMPRQRAFKRRQQFVNTIQTGMMVTTYGGIIGTVREINDKRGTVKVEIADGVLVDMLAIAVMQEFDPNKPVGQQNTD